MSYILEALKKLEQKRQREGAPNLLTLQGDTAPISPKRSFWVYAVAGTVLFNGIILLFLVWTGPPRHAGEATTVQTPIAGANSTHEEKEQHGIPGVPTKKESSAVIVNHEVSPVPHEHERLTEKSAPPPPRKDDFEVSPSKASPVAKPSEPAKATTETAQPTNKPLALKGKLLRIQDLPGDLKAGLPPLKMTVHSYNEQSQARFAIIDNSTVREGQFLIPKLKVEHITAGGVVFSYQGYRFLLAINQ